MINLQGITKKYNNRKAVINDLNISFPEGQMTVLVGPSGCGKSTTLKMIAGLEKATAGKISFLGKDKNLQSPTKRSISMVFQDGSLYPQMNVYDNLAYGLKNKNLGAKIIDSRVQRMGKILGLDHSLEKRPGQLSGGQKQRVLMASALVKEPEVILFDEPLSNLDHQLRQEIRYEIKKLHNEQGFTGIYVTHDQTEAMTLADQLVVMKDGVIEQEGTPLEIFYRPSSQFVAGFFGNPKMNFLNCTIGEESNGLFLSFDGDSHRLPLPTPQCEFFKAGKELVMGIRPSHILLPRHKKGLKKWTLSGKVAGLQTFGECSYVEISLGENHIIAEMMDLEVPRENASLSFAFNLNHAHFFDRATQKNILLL